MDARLGEGVDSTPALRAGWFWVAATGAGAIG